MPDFNSMKLTPYTCKCCGGRINVAKMRCDYCDTEYKDENLKRIQITQVRRGEHVLRTQVAVSIDHMAANPEGARDYILSELRNQLADGLLGFMKVTTSEDFTPKYWGRTEIIRGEVRVIDPMFEDRW